MTRNKLLFQIFRVAVSKVRNFCRDSGRSKALSKVLTYCTSSYLRIEMDGRIKVFVEPFIGVK